MLAEEEEESKGEQAIIASNNIGVSKRKNNKKGHNKNQIVPLVYHGTDFDEVFCLQAIHARLEKRHNSIFSNAVDEDSEMRIKTYVPCDHTGPCLKENGCDCAISGIDCESYCGCKSHCLRAFPGCMCKSENDCLNKAKCICAKTNRECDPNKCKGCKSYIN